MRFPWQTKDEITLVKEVLAKDSVKQVIDNFLQHYSKTAEGIILIWATDGELFIDTGGLSDAEILGSLQIMGHRIEHEGAPRV